jgi:hypothetical protein
MAFAQQLAFKGRPVMHVVWQAGCRPWLIGLPKNTRKKEGGLQVPLLPVELMARFTCPPLSLP